MITATVCVLRRPAPPPHVVRHRDDAPAGGRSRSFAAHVDPAAARGGRHPDEHHVAGRHRHLDRRAGRFVDRDGRERDAPAAASSSATSRCGATSAAIVAAGLPGRSAGRSSSRSSSCCSRSCRCSPWAASRGRCSGRWRSPSRFALVAVAVLVDHARARPLHDLHPRPAARRDREPARARRDRGLSAGARLTCSTARPPSSGSWRLTFVVGLAPVWESGRSSWRRCFGRWSALGLTARTWPGRVVGRWQPRAGRRWSPSRASRRSAANS